MKPTRKILFEQNYTKEELFICLLQNKCEHELKFLNDLFAYVAYLRIKTEPNAEIFNQLLLRAYKLFNQHFEIESKLQRSFYAWMITIISFCNEEHAKYSQPKLFIFAPDMLEFMRCRINMKFGNYVYDDDNLFIGYRPCSNKKIDELFVFIKNCKYNIFTFSPYLEGNKLSNNSLKKAKSVIVNWKGKKLLGYCIFESSLKFCDLLGFSVNYKNKTVLLDRKYHSGFKIKSC